MNRNACNSLKCMVALAPLLLLCSREYNPFADYGNAGLYVVHQSLRNRDTLDIFSTETLQVRVTVKELVEKFSVSTTANRLWTNPESTIVAAQFPQEPFTFCFSYYDTGWRTVVTTVYTTNSRVVTDSMHVYLRSVLHQDSVFVFAHDSVRLRTGPVRDRDVAYYWSFGPGVSFVSPVCSLKVMFPLATMFGTGNMWVWDGKYSSPADSFHFWVRDTVAPAITCVNNAVIRNDTIFTGDSAFNLRVQIADDLGLGIDSASVNGLPFDSHSGSVYFKLFDKTYQYPASSAIAFTIFALDRFVNGTSARKTYWLAFSSAIPQSQKASIMVLSPGSDTSVVAISPYPVSGSIIKNSASPLNCSVDLYVNGSENSRIWQISDSTALWQWSVSLNPGRNPVRIVAVDNETGVTLDEKDLSLVYTSSASDTGSPRILDIEANGVPAQGQYTAAGNAALAVEVIDDVSPIDSLSINGKAVSGSGYWYYDTIPLQHIAMGNLVTVKASDKKGNVSRSAAVIFRNNLPIVTRLPRTSSIYADSLYRDSVLAFDPDNDSLTLSKVNGPLGLVVNRRGAIQWLPALDDTGLYYVRVQIFDGYQPKLAGFVLNVVKPGQPLASPVVFATKTQDFPQYLVGGRDTLHMALKVTPGTGVAPFYFWTRIIGKEGLLGSGTGTAISWAPAASDTGYWQIISIVSDQLSTSDTIYPHILVVPPNRPCSLSVAYSADTLANGALRLNEAKQPFTLVFKVYDPDNPLVGRHRFTLYESASHSFSVFDSARVDTFVYTLNPALLSGYDTVIATVNDAAGADTMRVRLYFGFPPSAPAAVYPPDGAVAVATSPVLRFSCRDPDNDSLAYNVYLGQDPLALPLAATTADTSVAITGLAKNTVYYWKAVARDWKSQTQGGPWRFTTSAGN